MPPAPNDLTRVPTFFPTSLHHPPLAGRITDASALGHVLPALVTDRDGKPRALPTLFVDSSEFVVSKLKDRITHRAFGVVADAQALLHILRQYVERELDARAALVATAQAGSAR